MDRLERLSFHRDPSLGIARVASHSDHEDLRYVSVISGCVEITVEQVVHRLSAGGSLLFTPRRPHSLELISESAEIGIIRHPQAWIAPAKSED